MFTEHMRMYWLLNLFVWHVETVGHLAMTVYNAIEKQFGQVLCYSLAGTVNVL